MDDKDIEMTHIIGDIEDELCYCGFSAGVFLFVILGQNKYYYIYLTKDEDIKQECAMLVKLHDPHVSNTDTMLNIYLVTCKPSLKIRGSYHCGQTINTAGLYSLYWVILELSA